jgi:DNA-binding CsgD family transcriptional regulator
LTDSITNLTESQRTCLRLVGRGMSSKEIAIETGLSPATVDTYLKSAMARLGASNRRDAARLLTSWEQSQELGSPASPLPEPVSPRQLAGVVEEAAWFDWIRLPPLGGRRNDLDAAHKTLAILKVAGIGAVAVLALALLMAGALQTFR